MLGLSSGLTSVSAPSSRVLLETYTADWSSGVDGWASYSPNDAVATLTGNIDDPFGTSKNNCLRVEFNADETSICGIIKSGLFSASIRKGDYIEVTCNIYLESEYDSTGDGSNDVTDRWSGTDDVQTAIQMPGTTSDFFTVAQNQWVALDTPSEDADSDTTTTNTDSMIIFFSNPVDLPKDGARFYLHNFVVKLYRSQLFT